jgi:hypothetical protein
LCSNGVCEAPPGSKTAFVTSTVHAGDLGGLAGADSICNGLASQAGLAVRKGQLSLCEYGGPDTRPGLRRSGRLSRGHLSRWWGRSLRRVR